MKLRIWDIFKEFIPASLGYRRYSTVISLTLIVSLFVLTTLGCANLDAESKTSLQENEMATMPNMDTRNTIYVGFTIKIANIKRGYANKTLWVKGVLVDAKAGIIASSKGDIKDLIGVEIWFPGLSAPRQAHVIYHDQMSDITFIQSDEVKFEQPDALAVQATSEQNDVLYYSDIDWVSYTMLNKPVEIDSVKVFRRFCQTQSPGCQSRLHDSSIISSHLRANLFGAPLYNHDGKIVSMVLYQYAKKDDATKNAEDRKWVAIDINEVLWLYRQYQTFGERAPFEGGLMIQNVSQSLAESFGMPGVLGALVAKVVDSSPAQTAGLKVGDIIMAINGQTVQNASHYVRLFQSKFDSDDLSLSILRANQTLSLQLQRVRREKNISSSP